MDMLRERNSITLRTVKTAPPSLIHTIHCDDNRDQESDQRCTESGIRLHRTTETVLNQSKKHFVKRQPGSVLQCWPHAVSATVVETPEELCGFGYSGPRVATVVPQGFSSCFPAFSL